MDAKYNGLRIHMNNIATHSVAENKNGFMTNGKRKSKYSIFFNNLVGGYVEIPFDSMKCAEIVCETFDALYYGYAYSRMGDKFYAVFDEETGKSVSQIGDETMDEKRIYIPESAITSYHDLIDLNEIIKWYGFENNMVRC